MTSAPHAPLPDPLPFAEVEAGGRTLAVRGWDEPNGQQVALMVHGLGGSSLNWTDLSAQLRDDLTTLAVDLPGFGYSPPPADGDYTLSASAGMLAELIDRRDTGPVHVFGNSMGGAIALQLAARFPSRVASVTLISPALPQFTAQRANVHLPVLAVPGIGERAMERFLRTPAHVRAQATIDACYADPAQMPPQRLAEAVAEVERRDSLDYPATAFLQSLRALMATYRDSSPNRPWRLAERVECPVLVIYGRQDQLVNSRAAHRVTRHFPQPHVVVLPNSGHVAQMEHPELVAAAWRSFQSKKLGTEPVPT